MKKHFTTMMSLAATLFTAITLTSCGSDEPADEPIPQNQTVFSTGGESTRTSMDADRYFYWEPGDNIWVNSSGTTYLRSTSNTITASKTPACKFVFDATLTNSTYPVLYTGDDDTSTSATSVTIAATQTQSVWNDATHLGKSGDCGTATAVKMPNGSYEFHLLHRAAYLRFEPFVDDTSMPFSYTLSKIEITARRTSPRISGTYAFTHANGLAASPTTPAETDTIVTVVCGSNGFNLGTTPLNSCYAVIHPNASGATHALTVKYYVQVNTGPFAGAELEFEQVLAAKEYKPNGVTTISYQLSSEGGGILTYNPDFYMWDAPIGAKWYEGMAPNFNTIVPPTTGIPVSASRSCAAMPNLNELWWYVNRGDPRWDNTTRWMIEGDPQIYTGGVWIKRKAGISGFSSISTPNGNYLEKSDWGGIINNSSSYTSGGIPSLAEQADYFFLPAIGGGGGYHRGVYVTCWTANARYFTDTYGSYVPRAFYFSANVQVMVVAGSGRESPQMADTSMFK